MARACDDIEGRAKTAHTTFPVGRMCSGTTRHPQERESESMR